MNQVQLYIKPASSNMGAEFVCAFWAQADCVYPSGLAQRVLAVKIGDFEIPWPEGLTLVQALEAWKQGKD